MKSKSSKLIIVFIGLVYLATSLIHFSHQEKLKVTTWDALGYYMYLPATFIYNDVKTLSFYPEIEKKYQLQGVENEFYQFSLLENGNYAGKYFVGVSVLQSPFFFLAHFAAQLNTNYPADGFSLPYQLAIILAALLYLLLGLVLLRKTLLKFYSDSVVSLTFLFLCLASNLIQYGSIDVAQSHIYIFFLYSAVLYCSIQWHKNFSPKMAFLIGLIVGLAVLCRPTEIIMFFIPLLWQVSNKEKWKIKTRQLFRPNWHILYAAIGFILVVSLQLIYWKYTTGNFIYNVGSKWHFFNPHFRVLFGFEKGWFIYTPITIFFILGFFFLKKTQNKIAISTFVLLNTWIVIAWADWHYGGTYSTRALVQSYPVLAIPFAAFISWVLSKKIKPLFYIIGFYFIGLNLFQIYQYNTGVLHYNKMNFEYYKKIYLNPNVSEEDKKLRSL